ncbi:MAG: CBS domain-containing protein [Nitrospinaceae bacterium]|nr:CBS domain-containing protein [Nitrospina sp.]MBT5377110.1 CBS domain-containing protein [Nitrospinaceae bacterium]MBT5869523.1 CBS domain-containing protein [Nitrospinaceae bacterium]MBT6346073.1 CBS domain-containing protein [Nitrospina sp.]
MIFIKDLMVSSIISISDQSSAEAAAKLMCDKNISSLLVKEGNEYVGIITKTDLVKKLIAEGRDPKNTSVDALMSKPLISRDGNLQRSEINEFMLKKKIKHLAVTEGKNVVGVLTLKDMVGS